MKKQKLDIATVAIGKKLENLVGSPVLLDAENMDIVVKSFTICCCDEDDMYNTLQAMIDGILFYKEEKEAN